MTPKTLLATVLFVAMPVGAIAAFSVDGPFGEAEPLVLAQAQQPGPGGAGGPGGGPGAGMGPGSGMGPGAGMGPRSQQMFKALDTDGDGAVSQQEFLAGHQNRPGMFAMLDADEDGAISQEEFVNRREARRQARFKALDTDSDGRLTQQEYEEHLAQVFESMDDDDDGKLTPEELRPQRGRR